ncbi:MAG: hypothetical protein KAR07_08750, partial [Spirochaetes bacterium]|nr:hypothetical protein [Spirochaetota bacterium]
MEKNAITTMVCYHDLLGFGNMVSVSGGTLDSLVGKIAHQRVNILRETISEVKSDFPSETVFFQMNDTAIAVCDIDINISSMFVDSKSIGFQVPPHNEIKKALKFVCGSAKLHHRTIEKENNSQIGPAGRSFVVLGSRWPIDKYEDSVIDVPELQANLAFSEAYIADSIGSQAGFIARSFDSLYINDLMWSFMNCSTTKYFNLLSSKLP